MRDKTIMNFMPGGTTHQSGAQRLREMFTRIFTNPTVEHYQSIDGLHVYPDGWTVEGDLHVCESGILRLRGEQAAYAIRRIEVTGREIQWHDRHYARTPKVRVRITFWNGDGPDTTTLGWLA